MCVCVCTAVNYGVAFAQIEGSIFISEQASDFDCSLLDATPGLRTIHVLHTLSPGAKASRFRIVSGPGVTMTYVSEVHYFPMTVGNTQSGISICYGDCLAGDHLLVTMTYMAYGTSSYCSKVQVAGHPASGNVEAIRCNDVPVRMYMEDLSVSATLGGCGCPFARSIPGTPQYFDCSPVPVEQKTWGAIKALYRD